MASRRGFSLHQCHPPSPPSSTHQRLRAFIAELMRMSPIDQPLMLVTSLGRRSDAPAQHVTESG
jgi:hypothetical protein